MLVVPGLTVGWDYPEQAASLTPLSAKRLMNLRSHVELQRPGGCVVWSRILSLLLLLSVGCTSPRTTGEAGACSYAQEQQPLTLKCFPHSLSPVTDPASPDFGHVNCQMIEFFREGNELCDCALPGYRVTTSVMSELARSKLEEWGSCDNGCCDGLCYCELLQHEGAELAACQGDEQARQDLERSGWCYVEPSLGVGDPSTTDACPPGQPQRVFLTPFRADHSVVMVCETPAT